MDIVPMPLARSRAPENVFTQSAPAASSSCATRPLPALAMKIGRRRSTLARSFCMMAVREVRGTINGGSPYECGSRAYIICTQENGHVPIAGKHCRPA